MSWFIFYYLFYINNIIKKVILTLTLTIQYLEPNSFTLWYYAEIETEPTLTTGDVNVNVHARN